MNEEPGAYPHSKESGSHEHRYGVAIGKVGIVRWCKRCGQAHIMQEERGIAGHRPTVYRWVAIQEAAESTL